MEEKCRGRARLQRLRSIHEAPRGECVIQSAFLSPVFLTRAPFGRLHAVCMLACVCVQICSPRDAEVIGVFLSEENENEERKGSRLNKLCSVN